MKRTIEIEAYIDTDGKPTCSLEPGKDCPFLLVRKWGMQEVCGFGEQRPLFRGGTGFGYIQPHKNCPVWKEKTE